MLTIGTIVVADAFSTVATMDAVPADVTEVSVVMPTPLVTVSDSVPNVPLVVVSVTVVLTPRPCSSNTSTRMVAFDVPSAGKPAVP